MKIKRSVSSIMASLLFMGTLFSFAGCGSDKGKSREKIGEDEPWYTSTTIDVTALNNARNYDGFYYYDPVVVDGMTFVFYDSHYLDKESGNYTSCYPICIFKENGELLREFDLSEEIPKSRRLCVSSENGSPVVYYSADQKICKVDIDKETGELKDPRETDVNIGSGQITYCRESGGYIFAIVSISGENHFKIIYGGEEVFEKKLNLEYASLGEVVPKDNGFEITMDYNKYFFDAEKKELKADGVVDLSSHGHMNDEAVGFDGRVYSKKPDGIYADGEIFLPYSDCDCNIVSLMDADLLSVDEDCIALSMVTSKYGLATDSPIVILLHKQETNPNSGKTIITATSYYGEIDMMTGEGICRFNNENSDYFVKYIGREFDFSYPSLEQQYAEECQKELMSKEAADICFGIDNMWWIQTEDYLVDLKEELNLDPNIYYTKITDSLSKDGHLYYMPLSFSTEGIWTERSYVKEGAKGFTFDEYKEFVSTRNNGYDVLSGCYDRDEYFMLSFTMMNDVWFNGKEVNISNENFEKMCSFFKENVPEHALIQIDDISDLNDMSTSSVKDSYTFLGNYGMTFLSFDLGPYKDPIFLGYPTSDGRGGSANITDSVAISASTDLKEPCIEFIKTLLSKDVQEYSNENPINRQAMETVVDRALDRCREEYDRGGFGSEAEAASYGYYLPTEAMKNAYIEGMENVEGVSTLDSSIRAIVYEEMSSYFTGNKDINEVEKTLQDRLETLYSEKYSTK